MADEAKIGTNWQADELDDIVADYFAMLEADLSGRPYVKSHHSKAPDEVFVPTPSLTSNTNSDSDLPLRCPVRTNRGSCGV